MGSYLGIDEVVLSQGELYTVLINKQAHGKNGCIIAIIKGIDAQTVCSVLLQMTRKRRFQAREITLDMASNMELIAKSCFPAAKRVIDRFHVQKLAYDAVQEMRIKALLEALDREAIEIHFARAKGERYLSPVLENGDSLKQLLARSRYLLFKKESMWTPSQQ